MAFLFIHSWILLVNVCLLGDKQSVRELVIRRRITVPPITAPSGESAGVIQIYMIPLLKKN